MTINKVVRIGSNPSTRSTFCRINFDGHRLSISGVEGPLPGGEAIGCCGQIVGHLSVTKFAPGWDADLLEKFTQAWKRWHLNDMHPDCEHQRATGLKGTCPVCGHSFGSKWLYAPVPPDVIEFLASLPDADRRPAWV